jgi:hypothetical protein
VITPILLHVAVGAGEDAALGAAGNAFPELGV